MWILLLSFGEDFGGLGAAGCLDAGGLAFALEDQQHRSDGYAQIFGNFADFAFVAVLSQKATHHVQLQRRLRLPLSAANLCVVHGVIMGFMTSRCQYPDTRKCR